MTALSRRWRPIIVLVLNLVLGLIIAARKPATVEAAYVVNDITLGSRVPTNSATYRAYRCAPSEDFADLTWCTQTQQTTNRGRTVTTIKTLAHAPDGTALYLMANAVPVTLSKSAIEAEIAQLSREIGARPSEVEWFEDIQGALKSVMVSWGRVKLEQLKGDSVAPLAEGKSPKQGVLIDTLGDLQRSAQSIEFPVYRIATGSGYLYAASFDRSGNGHRHYVAIEGTPLTIRQFERSLQTLLQRDRALAANDYSLWPEVARVTRRLARDTSVKAANDLLDKGFDRSGTRKLRSHVWATLPGGVIEHLAIHQYGLIDIYGANAEMPDIRAASSGSSPSTRLSRSSSSCTTRSATSTKRCGPIPIRRSPTSSTMRWATSYSPCCCARPPRRWTPTAKRKTTIRLSSPDRRCSRPTRTGASRASR